MYGAQETYDTLDGILKVDKSRTPCFRQKFTNSCRFKFGKESIAMNTPEMANVSIPIEFLCNDGEARRLLKV